MTQTRKGGLHIWTRYFARGDTDKRWGFAYLDKILCKNTRRKFPTFKRKSGRIALQLAPSLLSFALGPGFLHFKNIHLSTSFVCFFFISASLPSISSLWPSWFTLGLSNDKSPFICFLGKLDSKQRCYQNCC